MAVPPAYMNAVKAASVKYGVPSQLLAAQIQAESGWNPNAKSGAGAVGISQFMPGTAKGFGLDPTDPIASIDTQGKMMGRLLKQYHGRTDLALSAYNAGSGNVTDHVPQNGQTPGYVANIHKYMSNYPGLAQYDKSNGQTPNASDSSVHRAVAYNNIITGAPTAPVTASNGSSATLDTTGQTGGFNPLESLLQYTMQQSQPTHNGDNNSLDPTGGLLNILMQHSQQQDQTPTVTATTIPTKNGVPSTVTPGSIPANFPKDSIYQPKNKGRTDMGVDYSGKGVIPVLADAKIISVKAPHSHSGWPGAPGADHNDNGAYITYQILSGPHKGKTVFVAENITPTVKVGQVLKAGQVLALAHGTGALTEQGWAGANGSPKAYSYYKEGQVTPDGKDFAAAWGL